MKFFGKTFSFTFLLLYLILVNHVSANEIIENQGSAGVIDIPGGLETIDRAGSYERSLDGARLENPLVANSITALFQAIIDIVMIFAIPIIVFFIIYAGFLYVTARGSTETIQKAHKALLYAIIGALLIIGANVLIDVVGGTVQSITN